MFLLYSPIGDFVKGEPVWRPARDAPDAARRAFRARVIPGRPVRAEPGIQMLALFAVLDSGLARFGRAPE
jgi:hypothetical protein